MQCSFLEGKRILSCRSLGAVYIPALFELDEYCRSDRYKKCPLYRAPELSGGLKGPFHQVRSSLIAAFSRNRQKA